MVLSRGHETYGLVRRGRLIGLLLGVPTGSGRITEELFSSSRSKGPPLHRPRRRC